MGIGTRCADLYVCWAFYHDVADRFDRAEDVYRRGRDAHAEPHEQLEQAHRQFGFSMSQRLLHKDTYREEFISTMEERRNALTSLRPQRSGSKVGSVRTGQAVRSLLPGRVEQQPPAGKAAAAASNVRFQVYDETAASGERATIAAPTPTPTPSVAPKSVVQAIIDSSRKQENLREAGPWSQAGTSKKPLFAGAKPSAPNFPILEDMDCTLAPIECGKDAQVPAIRLLPGHVRTNKPVNRPFVVPAFVEEEPVTGALPAYDKCMLFPRPDESFSMEELAAYRWFRRRGLRNAFTARMDPVWGEEESCMNLRLYPQFQRRNEPDKEPWCVERCIVEDAITSGKARIVFPMAEIYPVGDATAEASMEEVLAAKWRRGELPNAAGVDDVAEETMQMEDAMDMDMDVTVAVKGRQSICGNVMRQSIAPGGRRSIRPPVANEEKRHVSSAVLSKFAVIKESGSEVTADASRTEGLPGPPDAKATQLSSLKLPETPLMPKPMPDELKPSSSRAVPSIFQQNKPTFVSPAAPNADASLSDVADLQQQLRTSIAVPKTSGPFRKSIIAIPKSRIGTATTPPALSHSPLAQTNQLPLTSSDVVNVDDDDDDEVDVPSLPPVVSTAPFAIFEDTIDDRAAAAPQSAPSDDIFKQPIPPSAFLHARRPLASRSKSPDAPITADVADQTANTFMPNETCSTQQFNFFIKAQSISTPKAKQRPGVQPDLELSPTQESAPRAATMAAETPPPSATVESQPDLQHEGPAGASKPPQLSIIMETTEGTTQLNSTSSDRDSECASKTAGGLTAKSQRIVSPPTAVQQPHNYGITLATAVPADIPSMCPVQMYEDRTETVPLANFLQRPNVSSLLPPTASNLTLAQPDQVPDFTLPALINTIAEEAQEQQQHQLSHMPTLPIEIGPIEIYRDPTELMPAIPSAALRALDHQPPPPNVLCDRLTMAQQPDISLLSAPSPMVQPRHDHNDAPPLLSEESMMLGLPATADASIAATAPAANESTKAPITTTAAAAIEKPHSDNEDDYFSVFAKTPKKTGGLVRFSVANNAAANVAPKMPLFSALDMSSDIPKPMPALLSQQQRPISPESNLQFACESLHIKDESMDSSSGSAPQPATGGGGGGGGDGSHLRIGAVAGGIEYSFSLDGYDAKDFTGEHQLCDSPTPDDIAAVAAATKADTYRSPVAEGNSNAAQLTYEPEESIYVPRVHEAPTAAPEFSDDEEAGDAAAAHKSHSSCRSGQFVVPDIDLNHSRAVIKTHFVDHNADPFDEAVHTAFLEQCDFYDYLRNLATCQMVQTVRSLNPKQELSVADRLLVVDKLLGQGKYGTVYAARCQSSGELVALKQQRPANLWEYYICLEVESRIAEVPHMMGAYMRVEAALIGNNAGVLVSERSKFGSLLTVCNKVKTSTGKNVSEQVVMMLAMQLLSAVDHLHACKIIHADIKPDNVLIMKP